MAPLNPALAPPVFRWAEPKPGSVCTVQELYDLRDRAGLLLPNHPVIEIPRGIINHASLRLAENHPSNTVESDVGGAAFHTHDWPVALISAGTTSVSTLIVSDLQATVRRATDLLTEKRHATLHGWLLRRSNTPSYEDILEAAATALQAPASSSETREQMQKALNGLRVIFAAPNHETLAYPFIEDLQRDMAQSVHEVLWSECDMVLFDSDVVHGRDVRTTRTRADNAPLFALSTVPRK